MKNIKWSSLFIGLICLCSCVDLTELNENPTKQPAYPRIC